MQLIQELTLVQKAGVFIGIPLILLFMLVAARRRRAAAAGGTGAAVASAAKPKRGRAKKDSGIPRRKRRKRAAEAAQSMGTPPPVPPAPVPQPAVPVVEPVAVAEATPALPAPEPEAPLAPPVPVAAAPVDDPYVQDIAFDDEQVAAFAEDTLPEVVVAAPGWPTPGELASSFDPDAFDPLPAAEPAPQAVETRDDAPDEVLIDEEPEQPTGVIEMPAMPADAYAEHDEPEIAQWDGEFDPATGWGEVEAPVPVAVAAESEEWYDSDHAAAGGGSSLEQPNPVDLDQFWTEADTEEPWSDSSEVEILADMVEDAGAPDWVRDDEPAAWEVNATDAVAPATAHDEGGWTMAAPAHGSPVVLDLAGLAASGHSLELVIESSGDGKGVRLRFGSPSPAHAPVVDLEHEPELEEPHAEVETEPEYMFAAGSEIDAPVGDDEIVLETGSEPAFDDFDVPFLTGGTIATATSSTQPDEPLGADPVDLEMPAEVELHSAWVAEEIVEEVANQPEPPAQVAPAPALPDDELTEDPAQILAEIRARLAALDRRS